MATLTFIDTASREAQAMQSSPELLAQVLRDRERQLEQDRLARIATCCSLSVVDRLARALRPATYPFMGNRS
jgi:hypothetical protein